MTGARHYRWSATIFLNVLHRQPNAIVKNNQKSKYILIWPDSNVVEASSSDALGGAGERSVLLGDLTPLAEFSVD